MDSLTLWHVYLPVRNKFPQLNWLVVNDRTVKTVLPIELSLKEQFEIIITEGMHSDYCDLEYSLELYIGLRIKESICVADLSSKKEFCFIQIKSFEGSVEEVFEYLQTWFKNMQQCFGSCI